MKESGLEGYEYFAFISYSSKDAKFANKLQRHLERYRLPVFLSRQYPRTPRRLQPIFRDRTDLEQGNLGEMLMRGLRASKFLIVICSENSAQPNRYGKRYVDLEVESFVGLNPDVNRVRVIPIIYREKGGARATECIPPAVKALDLLALDVLDKGYKQTFNQIVSRMVGIKPGILWNRWQRAARKSGILLTLLAFSIIATLAGGSGVSLLLSMVLASATVGVGAYAAWRYVTPKVECYERFIEAHNMPRGINKLTAEEVAHRFCHYRFTHRKGRLRKVECCNSSGLPMVQKLPGMPYDEVSVIEIRYDEKGNVSRHIWKDDAGNVLRELLFEQSAKYDWISFRTEGGDFTAAHKQECAGERTAVTRYRVTRNPQGHITDIAYCNSSGYPCADSDGTWGRHFDVDERLGVITARYNMGKQGNAVRNHFGDVGRTYTYDAKGNLLSFTNVNEQGKAVYDQEGFATLQCKTDAWGNHIESSYHTPDGEPCMGISQAAMERITYNEQGFITSRTTLDTHGVPCLNCNHFSRVEYKLNLNGALLAMSFYGVSGEPCMSIGHYHKIEETTDAYGKCCSQTYYDTEGKRVRKDDGFSKKVYKYDEEGRIRAELYYDEHDEPCRFRGLYHKQQFLHDDYDNICERACYDIDDTPCINADGVFKISSVYDEHHNLLEEVCYAPDGSPCFNPATGICRKKAEYDRMNNKIQERYYGPDGSPCYDAHGVSVKEWTYDELGRQTSERCYDENESPILNDEGFAKVEWVKDDMGNTLETKTYDNEGKLCAGVYPYAADICTYNEAGHLTGRRFLNEQMQPVAYEGAARLTYRYDERHRVVRECRFDENNNPAEDEYGVSEYRYEYDRRGRKSKVSYFGADGCPCLGENGVAAVKLTYDDRGYPQSHAYFDECGLPCTGDAGYASIRWVHNDLGKDTEIHYFDAEGRPVCINGYATVLLQYDTHGNCLGGRYLDEHGQPAISEKSGISAFSCEYDSRHNKIKEQCYGVDGAACLNHNGTATEEWTYNEFNQRTSVTYKDINGKLCCCAAGYARMLTHFDLHGRRTCLEFFGADAKPCMATNPPAAKLTRRYDRLNRVTEDAYFNAEGKRCCVDDGDGIYHAYVTYSYETDDDGFPTIITRYYDENDNLIETS